MPEKVETTHTILERQLIVYRRKQSGAWQCRFKVGGQWQRATTKELDFKKAVARAKRLMIEAEIRLDKNLPVVTRRFRDIAKLAVERMQQEIKNGTGKVSFKDYIRVIDEYLIPFLGNRAVTNIDTAALDEFEVKRIEKMGKQPSKSTLLTHNAALNRVLDEAQMRGFLTEANRPKIEAKGRDSDRRPAFTIPEIRALIAAFPAWIDSARSDESREARQLMRDYCMVLLDTGARPGVELLDLTWNKVVEHKVQPRVVPNGTFDGELQEPNTVHDLQRSVTMTVDGKTGRRDIVGMSRTVDALRELGKRNLPDIEQPLLQPLKDLAKASNKKFVFRRADGSDPSPSFQKMFERFLNEHNLLIDPRTSQKRVFYSLRHTYATLALTHDKVPIHTLAKQMGTSVLMIEKHYSHLKVVQAINQLRGIESRQLIDAGNVIDEMYKSVRYKIK
jgi:integrase